MNEIGRPHFENDVETTLRRRQYGTSESEDHETMDETERFWAPYAAVRAVWQYLKAATTAISFWLAICLPFLYIPLLTTNLKQPPVIKAFFLHLALHAGTIVLGHGYGRK